MRNQSINYIVISILAFFISFFAGCENRDEVNGTDKQNVIFNIDTKFVRLANDSTDLAGVLEVTSNVPEIKLKWNVSPKCNVDTSLTSIPVQEGSCIIPIKWRELTDSVNYAPQSVAFNGGVLVTAGEYSKYVPLVWADEVDSVKLCNMSSVRTRADEAPPAQEILNLTPPETLNMTKATGGAFFVDFSGISAVFIDAAEIQDFTNIDVSRIPPIIRTPSIVELKWNPQAPETNFYTRISCMGGSITKILNINYVVPIDEPLVWEFISSSVTDGNDLPAAGATVIITAKTNKPWSIESSTAEISPVPDYGTGIGIKTLTLHIQDNPGPDPRPVSVLVKSQGVLKESLTFTQLAPNGAEGALEFISSDPVSGATISSAGITSTVKVKTNAAWWIDLNGSKTTFPAGAMGEKTGTITVPASTSTTNQIVTYTIGYNNTIVKSISYIQPAQGSEVGGTLEYISSNLPAGNIPATAKVYTFNFKGGYTGQLRVRSVDAATGNVLFNGPIGTSHTPKVTVPANTSTNTRNIKFQYRLIDVTEAQWEDLPASTNRIQDGETASEEIKPSKTLSPGGNIPEDGGRYTCTFTGGSGNVILKAMKTRVNSTTATEAARSASIAVPGDVSVIVPLLDGLNATISFEYSIDNGQNWIPLNDNRNQLNTWLIVDAPPRETIVPATNGSISFVLKGNAKQPVTIYVKYEGREIGHATGYAPSTLVVPVEDNPSSSPRRIAFSYRTVDGQGWLGAELTQAGK